MSTQLDNLDFLLVAATATESAYRLYRCGCKNGAKVTPAHNGWVTCEGHMICHGQRVERPTTPRRIVGKPPVRNPYDFSHGSPTAEAAAMERLLTETPNVEPVPPAAWAAYFPT